MGRETLWIQNTSFRLWGLGLLSLVSHQGGSISLGVVPSPQYQQHHWWGPGQNENAGPLFQKLKSVKLVSKEH